MFTYSNACIAACISWMLFVVDCSKLTAQQRALLRAFAETEKDFEGTVKTFEGENCLGIYWRHQHVCDANGAVFCFSPFATFRRRMDIGG